MNKIRIIVAHPYPLFREGVRSQLSSMEEIVIVGETDEPAHLRQLVREHCPEVVLCDARISSSPLRPALGVTVDLVARLRQVGARGIFLLAPSIGPLKEEDLFQLLKYGVAAYELPTLSGQDLGEKIRLVARGESLITSTLLPSPEAAAAPCEASLAHVPEKKTQADFNLSVREIDILREIMRGYSNKQIAARLNISDQTVKNHITSILKKMHRSDRTAAVVLALSRKLLSLEEAGLVAGEG